MKALTPRGDGHQFVIYADACSGVPGALHEDTFAQVNRVVRSLTPPPQFICFPGDEIMGLTGDPQQLLAQWAYWFDQEMGWLKQSNTPLYHTTGNHTTYDAMSEGIFRQVMAHLPQNGPEAQRGLSYFVRRDDLLLVFVHTLWSGLGGEGFLETEWLAQVLQQHREARHKLVFGHHPVFPVNGFAGPYQREIDPAIGRELWQLLVREGVLAYVCSHILAFDVQVHQGVLQILTAGAGTAHRMPPENEYLHCLQAALDGQGLRYQVVDSEGHLREWLVWPWRLPPTVQWPPFSPPPQSSAATAGDAALLVLAIEATTATAGSGAPQTLLSAGDDPRWLPPIWIGLAGAANRLTVLLSPTPGRSPHLWYGPAFPAGRPFQLQLALHTGMGPGGLLWRHGDSAPWSSLKGASPWGLERLDWPHHWLQGQGPSGQNDRPFRGQGLQIRSYYQHQQLRRNKGD